MPRTATVPVLAARRTPFGRVHGVLSGWHPVELLAHALTATFEDIDLEPAETTTVLAGCAHPVGAQSANVARAALLAAGWPESIPGVTLEQGAGSSHRALHLGVGAIAAGADLVVVAGVEVMSLVPDGAPALHREYGRVWGPGPAARYQDRGGLVPVGVAGDRLAAAHGWGRSELDDLAAEHRRRLPTEQPALIVTPRRLDDRDQVRPGSTVVIADEQAPPVEPDAAPIHGSDGVVAATNTANDADGAAVVVLASPGYVERTGRHPVVHVTAIGEAAVDPVTMFGSGAAAARSALDGVGLTVDDVTVAEVDTAHAPAARAVVDDLGSDINPTGGGLARGRPLGAVGAGLVAELATSAFATGVALAVTEAVDGCGAATVLSPP